MPAVHKEDKENTLPDVAEKDEPIAEKETAGGNTSEDDFLDAVVKSTTISATSQKPRERKRTKHPRRQSCK